VEITEVAHILGILLHANNHVGSNFDKTGTDVMIFKNIFAENFGEKIGVFDLKQS
jgi:hypothetical protein